MTAILQPDTPEFYVFDSPYIMLQLVYWLGDPLTMTLIHRGGLYRALHDCNYGDRFRKQLAKITGWTYLFDRRLSSSYNRCIAYYYLGELKREELFKVAYRRVDELVPMAVVSYDGKFKIDCALDRHVVYIYDEWRGWRLYKRTFSYELGGREFVVERMYDSDWSVTKEWTTERPYISAAYCKDERIYTRFKEWLRNNIAE